MMMVNPPFFVRLESMLGMPPRKNKMLSPLGLSENFKEDLTCHLDPTSILLDDMVII
jgi:hypothetical protein